MVDHVDDQPLAALGQVCRDGLGEEGGRLDMHGEVPVPDGFVQHVDSVIDAEFGDGAFNFRRRTTSSATKAYKFIC